MKQVLVRGGDVVVEEIPVPSVGPGTILVQVAYSCVSVGTELTSVKLSGMPLYRRALKQPHNVRRFLDVARDQGLLRTVDIVRGRLASGMPTGYSVSGTVIAVGDDVAAFALGDRVACAGAGIANHAEYVSAPVNLAVKVPDGLDLDLASTVTLGAIALQGVRRAAPTLGESVAVIGLGILGQLTVQLLRANGCHVIGTVVNPRRIERALSSGMDHGIDPASDDFVGAESARKPCDAVDEVIGGGIDAMVHSTREGALDPTWVDVSPDDVAAVRAKELDGKLPEDPEPNNRDGLAEGWRRATPALERDRTERDSRGEVEIMPIRSLHRHVYRPAPTLTVLHHARPSPVNPVSPS